MTEEVTVYPHMVKVRGDLEWDTFNKRWLYRLTIGQNYCVSEIIDDVDMDTIKVLCMDVIRCQARKYQYDRHG